jgi:hypothetical protein
VRSGGEVAWISRLEPGATAALSFGPNDGQRTPAAAIRAQGSDPTGELSADGVAEVALTRQELRPGEICLVAQVVDEVPGLTVTPASSQSRQAAILVVHLDTGTLPPPKADSKLTAVGPRGARPNPGYTTPATPEEDPAQ